MYMSTVFESTLFDGAVMLTASHLPFNRNGVKFFTKEGGLNESDIKNILLDAEKDFQISNHLGLLMEYNIITDYAFFFKK